MNKKIFIGAVAVAVSAVLIAGPSLLADRTVKTAAAGAPSVTASARGDAVFSVKTEKAVVRTLQAYIEVNGDVVAETNVDVVPDAAGKLVNLKVEVGSTVKKGQLIAEVDPSRPGTAYSLSPVYAPISGTVTSAPLSVGATVSTATTVAAVGVMDKLELKARIPERDVGQLRPGLKAQVSLEAFPGRQFAAVVERVSPVVDAASRSKEIVLKFAQSDARVNAGMFARIKLDTVSYPNRVVVPDEALTTQQGAVYVYVLKPDGTVARREVKTGVGVDGLTEVSDGIAEGEVVVTQGQQFLSDGVKVRVINASGSEA
jgi:multidrug efflux pump subunit AcrA (membrane-fusion protein)